MTVPETPALMYSLRPGLLGQESWGPMSADGGEGWESGPRRRDLAPPGQLVCPVPHLHVAGEIDQLGTVRQPSGGCFKPTLPHRHPKRAPTPPERP
jgi:hypothetical protein